MQITCKELAFALNGEIKGNNQNIVKNFIIDSRQAIEHSAFFAIKGEKTDGHNFITSAFNQGSSVAIIEYFPKNLSIPSGKCLIKLQNTVKALGKAAVLVRNKLKNTIFIGITGSCGKTSTKEITASILKQVATTTYTQGNLNNHLGVPLTLGNFQGNEQFGVIEMGMNNFGEISYLSNIVKPQVAIITSICPAHLEKLNNIDGVRKAKLEITDGLSLNSPVILPSTELSMINFVKNKGLRVITFGTDKNSDYHITSIKTYLDKSVFTIQSDKINDTFELSLPGEYQCHNAAAAIAAVAELGITNTDLIKNTLQNIKLPSGRSKIFKLTNNINLMDDCYNASPGSFNALFEHLRKITPSNLYLILGDMLELGNKSEDFHKQLGNSAASLNPKLCIFVGTKSTVFTKGFKKNSNNSTLKTFLTSEEASEYLQKLNIQPHSTIVIKASRGIHLEQCKNVLLKNLSKL